MTIARKSPLPKVQRLTRSADFARVYAAGESVAGKFLVVWRLRRPEPGPARMGVVASKRAIGKAHDRNRAKRLLREAGRNSRGLFSEGYDYVLIARRRIAGTKCQQVQDDLLKAVQRLK